jgi:hypothetical protein
VIKFIADRPGQGSAENACCSAFTASAKMFPGSSVDWYWSLHCTDACGRYRNSAAASGTEKLQGWGYNQRITLGGARARGQTVFSPLLARMHTTGQRCFVGVTHIDCF